MITWFDNMRQQARTLTDDNAPDACAEVLADWYARQYGERMPAKFEISMDRLRRAHFIWELGAIEGARA